MNPLEWSGPDFLALYATLLVGGLVAAFLLRRQFREPGGEPLVSGVGFSPYELALLNDGNGPVGAAVASLFQRKALLVEDDQLRPGGLPSDVDPFERAVYAAVEAGHTTPGAIRQHVRRDLDWLEEQLVSKGLLLRPGQASLARWVPPLLTLGLVLLLGFSKALVGLNRGRPVGFLFALTLVGGIALVLFLLVGPRRSRLGDATLHALKEKHQPLRASVGTEGSLEAVGSRDLAMAVGLFGASALSISGYQPLRHYLAPPGMSGGGDSGLSADSGSSCSSSSSSSCGGGGGCGGCGGGGGD